MAHSRLHSRTSFLVWSLGLILWGVFFLAFSLGWVFVVAIVLLRSSPTTLIFSDAREVVIDSAYRYSFFPDRSLRMSDAESQSFLGFSSSLSLPVGDERRATEHTLSGISASGVSVSEGSSGEENLLGSDADFSQLRGEIRMLSSLYLMHTSQLALIDWDKFLAHYDTIVSGMTGDARERSYRYGELYSWVEPYLIESRSLRAKDAIRRSIWVYDAQGANNGVKREAPFLSNYSQIEVDLGQQRMYAYEDGEMILATHITSGRRRYETIEGVFSVYGKQKNKLLKSPFANERYELWVDHWIAFSGAYGIHDTCNKKDCWRTQFGGRDYMTKGSHGCINTPYNQIAFLYDWAKIGTLVYVHK